MQVMNQFRMIGIIFKESCYQKDKAEKKIILDQNYGKMFTG